SRYFATDAMIARMPSLRAEGAMPSAIFTLASAVALFAAVCDQETTPVAIMQPSRIRRTISRMRHDMLHVPVQQFQNVRDDKFFRLWRCSPANPCRIYRQRDNETR